MTDKQFSDYIDALSDSYEKIKDHVRDSDLGGLSNDAQNILGEVANFRDIACTALRDSHINKNFRVN